MIRHIKSGLQFDHLFPKPLGQVVVVKCDADVFDTLQHIPRVVRETTMDTLKIAKLLKGKTVRETCSKIWRFVFDHIAYAPDKNGYEELRRPSRAWADRKRGVDCDCYSIFISSILYNLGIRHKFRITKYGGKNYFQHIYPIVPTTNGKHITIDCVVNAFDYEETYSEKLDKPMDLHYLNGIGGELDEDVSEENFELLDGDGALSIDAIDLLNGGEELGRRRSRFGRKIRKVAKRVKKAAGKAIHAVNRINPAAGLLRLGFLASMKLNLMKVAQKLRYAYLNESQAARLGIESGKYKRLQQVRLKAEKIFHGAGGKTQNLRKAILTGKGNLNKEVALSGLYSLGSLALDTQADIRDVIGADLYESEVEADYGLSGNALGAVVTATAIAAATAAVTAIAALLKQLGTLKQKGASDDPNSTPDGEEIPEESGGFKLDQFTNLLPKSNVSDNSSQEVTSRTTELAPQNTVVKERPVDTHLQMVQEQSPTDVDKPQEERKGFLGFWDKWYGKLSLIGTPLAALGIWGGIHLHNKAKTKKEALSKKNIKRSVSGTPSNKGSSAKKKASRKSNSKSQKQVRFELL